MQRSLQVVRSKEEMRVTTWSEKISGDIPELVSRRQQSLQPSTVKYTTDSVQMVDFLPLLKRRIFLAIHYGNGNAINSRFCVPTRL